MSTGAAERQFVVDRLRGFALLGVLLVNAPFLLTGVEGITAASMPTPWDRAAGFLTWTLFQAKSYVVFSFLFGYSFSILLESVSAKGLDGRRVYRQRLLALGLFGAAHAALLFVGDILVLYALLGGSLLWLRRLEDRTLFALALALLLGQLGVFAVLAQLPSEDGRSLAWIDRSWREDGLLAATWTRLQVWPVAFGFIVLVQGLLVAALFCIGLVAGRRRWLACPAAIEPQLRRIRFWGFLLGLPIQVLAGALGVGSEAADSGRVLLALAIMYPTAPLLSAAYVASIALLPRRGLTRMVEADGSMSLSVYLAESLVMTCLAAGWGLGLFGLRTGAAFLLALSVWVALAALASLWRRTLGVGPAERLLRRLTYRGIKSTHPVAAAAERRA